MLHGENAFLAEVAQEVHIKETIIGDESGYEPRHRYVFKEPRVVDYRASVYDIANYLMDLMTNEDLRKKMGQAGRERALKHFDYRVVAKKFVEIVTEKFNL
jgi:glycosyltransferase involved in cell wall biosynthesis